MSTTVWAITFQCDYPGCQSVGDAPSRDQPPAGWLSLHPPRENMDVRDMFGRMLSEFCSLHADVPLSKLAEQMRKRAEETS